MLLRLLSRRFVEIEVRFRGEVKIENRASRRAGIASAASNGKRQVLHYREKKFEKVKCERETPRQAPVPKCGS